MSPRRDSGSFLCCGVSQSLANIATKGQGTDRWKREGVGWLRTVSSVAGLLVTSSFLCISIGELLVEQLLGVRYRVRDECGRPVLGCRELLTQEERNILQK